MAKRNSRGLAPPTNYALAMVGAATATGLTLALWPVVYPYVFALYFLTLIPVGLYAELGPALLASGMSLLAQKLALFEPRFSWAVTHASVAGQTLFLFVAITVSFVTSRFREERLHAEQQRRWFEATLASIGDAVIATDAQSRISFMNRIAEQLTGWSRSEAVGHPLREIFRLEPEEGDDAPGVPAETGMGDERPANGHRPMLLVNRQRERIPIAVRSSPICPGTQEFMGMVLVFRDLTLERRAQARQRHAERCLRSILEGMSDAFVSLDAEWRYTYVNAAAERSLGMPRQELLGRVIWEALPYLPGSVVEQELQLAATQRLTREFEVERAASGRWFRCTASPTQDGGLSIYFHEITEQRLAAEALRESEERLRVALQAGEIGVWDWNIPQDKLRWSERLYQIHGLNPGEFHVTMEACTALVHPEDRTHLEEAIRQTLEQDAPFNLEFRVLSPAGEVHWLSSRAQLIRDAAGQPLHLMGATLDITERRTLEEELRRQARELAEAGRRKDEFLAMLSHELRNPLTPILNSVHVLRPHAADNPFVERHRQVIERQARHLARMVEDLLDVSRITRGKIELRREWIDLNELVDQAVQVCGPLIEARRHELSVHRTAELLCIQGDRDRLIQVLTNLLQNAAKYTPPGGQIELTFQREGEWAVIRVRDTGEGISPELLPHVFELFTQGTRSLDRAQGGLGIGLTMVRNLVLVHGGTVQAESPGLGRGSLFTVRLPAGPPETKPGAITPPHGTHQVAPSINRRILVVEDNFDAAETVQELLESWGYEGHVVHSGTAALVAVHEFQPDVVLLDIGLPEMDGYAVARQIQQMPLPVHPILIALTGYAREEDRQLARAVGFAHHLAKPVDPDTLRQVLEGLSAPIDRTQTKPVD